MNLIGFIFGKDPSLSLAEVVNLLSVNSVDYEIVFHQKEILIIRTKGKLPFTIDDLGGTVKVFYLISQQPREKIFKTITKDFKLPQKEQRVNFGISLYGQGINLFSLGKDLKAYYQDNGLAVRYVSSRDQSLSSVIVTENKLLERGFEVIIVQSNNDNYLIGRTIAVQGYKSYSKRDYGRPKRDDRSGMLPPKLAQIMINLGNGKKDGLLYDPFCGSGTILQEAILFGYNNVAGSDNSQKAIDDTTENLNWLEQTYCSKSKPVKNIFKRDILSSCDLKASNIISEGYLGSPKRKSEEDILKEAKNLSDFYQQVIVSLGENLAKKDSRIVLAAPFFSLHDKNIFLDLEQAIKKVGLANVQLNKIIPKNPRGNLSYLRPGQTTGREIFILERR